MLTIFSDLVSASVKKEGKTSSVKGRWCLICRQVSLVENTPYQGLLCTIRARKQATKESLRKAFFTGGNSSCRAHIRQHYDIYKERCAKANIPENHHAIPRHIYRQMKANKKTKGGVQVTLDAVLEKASNIKVYTREGATHSIAQFVACDDQVGATVELRNDTDIL